MAGIFYQHEVLLSPDTCRCTIARDSSLSDEAHRLSAKYVVQCAEHAAAGSTAVEVHQHNVSKNVAVNALTDALPDQSWVPIIRDGAVPVKTPTGWQFDDADIEGRTLLQPVEFLLNLKTGEIALRHPDADQSMLLAASLAIANHPIANLALADDATAQSVFAAKDATPGASVFWSVDSKGAIVSDGIAAGI